MEWSEKLLTWATSALPLCYNRQYNNQSPAVTAQGVVTYMLPVEVF